MLKTRSGKRSILDFSLSALAGTQEQESKKCPYTAPIPFTSALNVNSKYDPNDPSRSTEIDVDANSLKIQQHINRFSSGISYFGDYYLTKPNTSNALIASACLNEWLTAWASSNALTSTDSTSTGKAIRVWALSSIASTLLKTQTAETLPTTTVQWLDQIANQIINDYDERRYITPNRTNNHDYWAAWAVAATGLINQQRTMTDWGYSMLLHATNQAYFDPISGTYYLPNELARGHLAAFYTHFALAPLSMLSAYLPEAGYTLDYHALQTLSGLGSNAYLLTEAPDSLAHLGITTQSQVSPYVFAWTHPFNTQADLQNDATTSLESQYQSSFTNYPQLGGNVQLLPLPASR